MAVATTELSRPGSNEKQVKITDLDVAAQMITQESGVLKHVHVRNGTAGALFIKLYNKASLVAPATDDPDHQLILPNTNSHRVIEFDSVMGAFSGGMQIAASDTAGPSASSPATGVNVDVYWTKTS